MAMTASQWNRQVREAQRQAERAFKRQIDQVNRANKRAVDDYNRKVEAHNRREVDRVNRRLRSEADIQYRPDERALAERVHQAIEFDDGRDYDVFLSYARIDGEDVATELRAALEKVGVQVWFDAVSVQPGKSQSLQMDAGLRKARAGIAVLTPAYLAGRFWTQRELGALLHKPTLIPVLHGVTFDDVKEYSGILPDLAGFTTVEDDIAIIAGKIAPAVLN